MIQKLIFIALLGLIEPCAFAEAPFLSLVSDRPHHLFAPGEDIACTIIFTNSLGKLEVPTLSFVARNLSGDVVASATNRIVNSPSVGDAVRFNVRLPASRREQYRIEMALRSGSRTYSSEAFVTVWGDDIWKPVPPVRFGFTHYDVGEPSLRVIAARLGAGAPFEEEMHFIRLEADRVLTSDEASRAVSEARMTGSRAICFLDPIVRSPAETNRSRQAPMETATNLVASILAVATARGFGAEERNALPFIVDCPDSGEAIARIAGADLVDAMVFHPLAAHWERPKKTFDGILWRATHFGLPYIVSAFTVSPEGRTRFSTDGGNARLFLQMIVFGSDVRCLGFNHAVLQDVLAPPSDYLAWMLSGQDDFKHRLLDRGLLRAKSVNGGDIRPALLAWQFAAALVSGGSEFRSCVYRDGVRARMFRFRGQSASVWTLGDDAQAFPAPPEDLSYAAFPTNSIQICLRADPATALVSVFDIYGRQLSSLRPDAAGIVSATVEPGTPVVILGAGLRRETTHPSDVPSLSFSPRWEAHAKWVDPTIREKELTAEKERKALADGVNLLLIDPKPLDAGWWRGDLNRGIKDANGWKGRVLFLGDSITKCWRDVPDLWREFFGAYDPLNLGVSGNQCAQVVWQLHESAIDWAAMKPELAVVTLGTNHLPHDKHTPELVADAIHDTVVELRARFPKIKVLVLACPPNQEKAGAPARKKGEAINALLPGALADLRGVAFFNPNAALLTPEGDFVKGEVSIDGTHLTRKGYELWGKAIAPQIKAMLAP